MPRSERIAVFGYGSLVSAESASETLGREARPIPATLRGWRRRFSLRRDNRACEKTFARASDGWIPDVVLALNVERAEETGAEVNGALIEVSEAELERLALREIRYLPARAEVEVEPAGFDRVAVFAARAENHAPVPPDGAVILRSYVEAVEEAFDRLGAGELDRYRRTTPLPEVVEAIDGVLVADAIPPGNPRAW